MSPNGDLNVVDRPSVTTSESLPPPLPVELRDRQIRARGCHKAAKQLREIRQLIEENAVEKIVGLVKEVDESTTSSAIQKAEAYYLRNCGEANVFIRAKDPLFGEELSVLGSFDDSLNALKFFANIAREEDAQDSGFIDWLICSAYLNRVKVFTLVTFASIPRYFQKTEEVLREIYSKTVPFDIISGEIVLCHAELYQYAGGILHIDASISWYTKALDEYPLSGKNRCIALRGRADAHKMMRRSEALLNDYTELLDFSSRLSEEQRVECGVEDAAKYVRKLLHGFVDKRKVRAVEVKSGKEADDELAKGKATNPKQKTKKLLREAVQNLLAKLFSDNDDLYASDEYGLEAWEQIEALAAQKRNALQAKSLRDQFERMAFAFVGANKAESEKIDPDASAEEALTTWFSNHAGEKCEDAVKDEINTLVDAFEATGGQLQLDGVDCRIDLPKSKTMKEKTFRVRSTNTPPEVLHRRKIIPALDSLKTS